MWGWIKRTARSIGRGISGALSFLGNGFFYGLHRLFGIPELIVSLLGFKPRKKMRLKVLILRDAKNKPLTSIAAVQAVVDEAKLAFRREANIRIIPSRGSDEIVEEFGEQNPAYVLTPKCDADGFRQIFTRVGRWFRIESQPHSSRGGATMFVVDNVLEKGGCFLGPLVDYGYVDGTALEDSNGVLATGGRKLTLAHELGHACDLFHRDTQRNLMAASGASSTGEQRTSHLTRWQRSVVRSSPRVRYW
jgi:hypothetical protein